MAEQTPSPTISLRERSLPLSSAEERLPKWLTVSFVLHVAFIVCLFLSPWLPSHKEPIHPVYTVDLIGGEKIGKANFGTELTAPPKETPQKSEAKPAPEIADTKKEIKETKEIKKEKRAAHEEKVVLKEKTKTEPAKKEPVKEAKEPKEDTKSVAASADSVRERLLQSAVERAKTRTEGGQKASKGEVLSSGSGEGEGAAAIGAGGRGGPGIVKGIDFIAYQNRILSTIKDNWAWVGQRTNLRVVVHFGIRENGEIVGLKIMTPSGDPSYDESVLRALKKSSPLPAPPESYRKDFADVELTFRPRDLGA
jgi:colicin import membrane protein